jgi:hypothetical protein
MVQLLREANVSKWPAILSEYDKSKPAFRLDTNYGLLKSTLTAARKAALADHAKFVVVLGDFLGHDYRKYYRKYASDPSHQGYDAFVGKTLQFITNGIAAAFPDISVYSVVGNNDTYSRDYASRINGGFFHDAANAWSSLIKDGKNRSAMQKTFPYAGYYAINRDGEHLKLIVLNSVLFSHKAKGDGVDVAAKRELVWLHKELADAKAHKQKVLIAMHIPVGIDVYATLRVRLFTLIEFWKPEYTRQFKADLSEYRQQVVGVLSGHMHSDWFQIMTFDDGGEIALTGTPAVSPVFGNNPGFKIYQYSYANNQISDFYTYYFPINEQQEWGLGYEFNRIYQPHCHLCSVIDGMKKLQSSSAARSNYIHLYTVGKGSEMQPISAQWDPYYRCFIENQEASTYKKCLGAIS